MTINNIAKATKILTLAAACFVIGTSARQLDAAGHKPLPPGIDQTAQYILNLVNTESGATRFLQKGETRWTYSMALAGPCTLILTEELQSLTSGVPTSPTATAGEITHYCIPVGDLDLGKFGTRLKFDRPGVMNVIISTERATIRRWRGDSATLPQNATVGYEAAIRFSKPNVDIFDVTVRLENALRHLASLCRAEATPVEDPFRSR
jgi:hypothetical protein